MDDFSTARRYLEQARYYSTLSAGYMGGQLIPTYPNKTTETNDPGMPKCRCGHRSIFHEKGGCVMGGCHCIKFDLNPVQEEQE